MLDIGGSGNTELDDVFLVTQWNGATVPFWVEHIRNKDTLFETFWKKKFGVTRQVGSFPVQRGGPKYVGILAWKTTPQPGRFEASFFLASVEHGDLDLIGELKLPDPSMMFQAYRFEGDAVTTFFFYRSGSQELLVAQAEISPSGSVTWETQSIKLDRSLQQLFILPSVTGETWVGIIYQGSQEAGIYEFSWEGGLKRKAVITAENGQPLTLLLPHPKGVYALTGTEGVSTRFVAWGLGPSGPQQMQTGLLPGLKSTDAAANAFLFQGEPFVSLQPILLQRLRAGDWTDQVQMFGSPKQVRALVESYQGPQTGLANPTLVSLGWAAPGATHTLANQYSEVISLFSFLDPIGYQPVEVQISPPPGTYKTTIQVTLTATPSSAKIYYRLQPNEAWQEYTAPFALFQTATVQAYAAIPGSAEKSPVQTAMYRFTSPPGEMDSDSDGVPDFVELGLDSNTNGVPDYQELGKGIAPVVSASDADGDGYSDLNEIVAGTNPYDASDHPAGDRLEDHSGFDLFVIPEPVDGFSGGTTAAAEGTGVRAYSLSGSLLRGDVVQLWQQGTELVHGALLTNLTVDTDWRFVVVGTDAHFDIRTSQSDKRIGRELVGIVPMPQLQPGLEVNYTFGNGDLATEAAAWQAAAQTAAASMERYVLTMHLGVPESLTALLFERKVELLLQQRGWPTNQLLSLFHFRSGDLDRTVPTLSQLLSLEHETNGVPAYRLQTLFDKIQKAIQNPPDTNVWALAQLTYEVWRISSRSNNVALGQFPLPVDVMRTFIRTGQLHSNYVAALSLPHEILTAAYQGVATVLGLASPRPKVDWLLTVQPGWITDQCTTLSHSGTPVSLYFADGTRYLFPESFQLVPGAVVRVIGYADMEGGPCSGLGIEVLSATLQEIPPAPITDTDGDLLPDGYELAFFGGLGQGPFDDADGDGRSNLQELLDGTDPNDSVHYGGAPVPLAPPRIEPDITVDGQPVLRWQFPAAYANHFTFQIESSTNLLSGFEPTDLTPTQVSEGVFEVTLPPPETRACFYRIAIHLR